MKRFGSVSFLIIAAFAIWWFILPPNLGGRTTLFMTRGISMEPYIVQGDLAILHKSGSYKVGDVIAYQAKTINATTLHRVIAVAQSGALTTKGDNNDFTDQDHPTQNEVIGKLDHRYRGGAKYVQFIGNPIVRVVGIFLVALAFTSIFFNFRRPGEADSEGGEGQGSEQSASGGSDPNKSPGNRPSWFSTADQEPGDSQSAPRIPNLITFCVAVGVAILSLATFMTTLFIASSGSPGGQLIYNLKGDFAYSGDAGPEASVVYPSGAIATGDPIYLAMARNIKFNFGFEVDSIARYHGTGSVKMQEVLSGKSGWTHIIPLSGTQNFDGKKFNADVAIDMNESQDIAQQAIRLTKLAEASYTMSIQAEVSINGTMNSIPVTDTFTPQVVFSVTPQLASLQAAPKLNAGPDGSESTDQLYGLTPAKSGELAIPPQNLSTFDLLGTGFALGTVRMISVLGALISILVIGYQLTRSRRHSGEDISEQVRDVFDVFTAPKRTIPVGSLTELERFAAEHRQSVSRSLSGTTEIFFVQTWDTSYVFARENEHEEPSGEQRFGVKENAQENAES